MGSAQCGNKLQLSMRLNQVVKVALAVLLSALGHVVGLMFIRW
jgi:hypothetical protein